MLQAKMPVLVTALSELNQPRYMTPCGIFEAWRDKEVVQWSRDDIPVDDGNIGLKGSPTKAETPSKTMKEPAPRSKLMWMNRFNTLLKT